MILCRPLQGCRHHRRRVVSYCCFICKDCHVKPMKPKILKVLSKHPSNLSTMACNAFRQCSKVRIHIFYVEPGQGSLGCLQVLIGYVDRFVENLTLVVLVKSRQYESLRKRGPKLLLIMKTNNSFHYIVHYANLAPISRPGCRSRL